MPLGAAAKSTINIDFTRAQGTNSSGKILFAPPRVVVGTTVLSTRAVVANISAGVGTIDLVRLPAGTYHVTEMIDNQEPYEWDFSLPLSAAATIEYETIAAVSPVPAIYTAVRTVNGVPPDPTTGNIEIAGGGGPSNLDGLSDVTIVTPANAQALLYDGVDTRWENRALVTGDIGGFQAAVDARVQLIVDAAPAALDTLNELAAALGDDPNFAGTITLALAGKQPLSTDLSEIAALTPANNDLLQQIAGAWASRTPAQVKTSLGLVKADVGLSNVTDTAQVPLSLFDAAGDILVGTADNAAAKLAKGADGTFLGVQSGSVGYFTPAGGGGGDLELYPPTTANFKEWTADPQVCSADFNHNGGVLLVMRMRWRHSSNTLSEIGFCVTSGATGPGAFSGVALYEDGTGIVNRLGQSADAGIQWTSQGPKSVALTAPITTMVQGDFYRVAILWNGSGAGKIAGVPAVILDALMNAGVRRSVYLTGQATFPATINVATANTNNATYWMSAK